MALSRAEAGGLPVQGQPLQHSQVPPQKKELCDGLQNTTKLVLYHR